MKFEINYDEKKEDLEITKDGYTIENKIDSDDVFDTYFYTRNENDKIKILKEAIEIYEYNFLAKAAYINLMYEGNGNIRLKKLLELKKEAKNYIVKYCDLPKDFDSYEHFWMDHNTRDYMRIIHQLGQAYAEYEKYNLAIREYKYLLKINPNDNQGIRFDIVLMYALDGRINLLNKALMCVDSTSLLYNGSLLAYYYSYEPEKFMDIYNSNKIDPDFKLFISNKEFAKPNVLFSLSDKFDDSQLKLFNEYWNCIRSEQFMILDIIIAIKTSIK